MADQTFSDEGSALPECGVESWNAFRRDHPKPEYVVLNFASLADAQLANIDLHRAFLVESDLQRANLTSASLERAILRKANCHESDLRRAILDGADLCRADFSGADLRDASLISTFLKRTDLRGADLSTARGLTSAQISEAFGDERTQLPGGVTRPESWVS